MTVTNWGKEPIHTHLRVNTVRRSAPAPQGPPGAGQSIPILAHATQNGLRVVSI